MHKHYQTGTQLMLHFQNKSNLTQYNMCLWVREWVLTAVGAYAPNSSSDYPPFLESLGQVLESAPKGDSIVLLLDFCASCSLAITNTIRMSIGALGTRTT